MRGTAPVRKHKYFEHLNIVIFVDLYTLLFYAINMNIVSLIFLIFIDFEFVLY